jgi:hypothetical protein
MNDLLLKRKKLMKKYADSFFKTKSLLNEINEIDMILYPDSYNEDHDETLEQ